jgi:hypothetical protein
MNRSVGLADFTHLRLMLKSATTNRELGCFDCGKESIYIKNNIYYANFLIRKTQMAEELKPVNEVEEKEQEDFLTIGQYYKI